MKLQNLAIIFIVIFIPLLLVLSYYLDQQRDTLALQAEYDLKLSEATKEGIKAFEINTVDWESTKQTYARNNAKATINTFITSLANNLNISGTAREYMLDYIPAVALTMYDGYYVYAPAHTPVTIENPDGVQLFLQDNNEITTDPKGTIIYEPLSGGATKAYIYTDSKNETKEIEINYTTEISEAKKEYKHTLNNKTAYSEKFTNVTDNKIFIVNYTLDNKVTIYVNDNTVSPEEPIEKVGYLVYFGSNTILPMIKIEGSNISLVEGKEDSILKNTQYSNDAETTKIEPEILREQVLYKEPTSETYDLHTHIYIYSTSGTKLYYDESKDTFFAIDDNIRKDISDEPSINVGDDECQYKSVSILTENTKFRKIYQVLNGKDKGKWYIDLKNDEGEFYEDGILDTEIKGNILSEIGLDDPRFAAIYKDYSAINYYVEAYAFTNWVRDNLGGTIEKVKFEYKLNDLNNTFELEEVSKTYFAEDNMFNIGVNNNPEDETSIFVEHKKEVMKDSINKNLNSAIYSYNRNGRYDFKLPILTDGDWEQIFSNISLITFFQGVPIGLKYYNNYAIATSTTNREYVDPNEIFFTGTDDKKYHQVYCKECKNKNEVYTGYRSTEYTLREYNYKEKMADRTEVEKTKYYYQHNNQTNKNTEIGCYYCIINKANYTQTSDGEITYLQTKSYNEALARERYYQNERVRAKVGVNIIYDSNLEQDEYIVEKVSDVTPQTYLCEPNESHTVIFDKPEVKLWPSIKWKLKFNGWNTEPDGSGKTLNEGQIISNINDEDIILYAQWTVSISELPWTEDYKWDYSGTVEEVWDKINDSGTYNRI